VEQQIVLHAAVQLAIFGIVLAIICLSVRL